MQVTLDEDGETRVRDKFVVSAPVAGRLQRIELEPGDPVVSGKTVVARLTTADAPLLDPRTRGELAAAVEAARAAVGQARAEFERATAELTRARTTLQRQQELMKAGAIAADNLDAAETAVATAEEARKAAEFAVSRSEYELQLARARLQAPAPAGRAVEVVAPVNGVILKRLRESESIVPGRRTAARDRRAGTKRDRRRLPLDRCGPHPAGRGGAHRRLGRQRAAQRPRAPRRACRVHESLGARRRGAARQRAHRLRRSVGRQASRRRLSRRGPRRRLARGRTW